LSRDGLLARPFSRGSRRLRAALTFRVRRNKMTRFCLLALLCIASGCSSQEAAVVHLPVESSGADLKPSMTDLGYLVQVDKYRLAFRDLQFTLHGEAHASSLSRPRRLWNAVESALIPTAYAHPGHLAGGEVTGELLGPLIFEYPSTGRVSFGQATLLAGQYEGANLTFRKATTRDGLTANDPLLGHSVYIEGSAQKAGKTVHFTAQVDVDDNTQMVGAPFEVFISETSQLTLQLEVLTTDPFTGKTLFSGIDFNAFDPDGDGQLTIAPGQDAHNILRRSVQSHDFFFVKSR
jgi:hypothetical protein